MLAKEILYLTLGFTALYALLALAGIGLDSRMLDGHSVWLKPLKFGLSLTLYTGTLLWAILRLSDPWRNSVSAATITTLLAVCTLLELAYIGWQAAIGQPSHFNLSTPWHRSMYSAMAVGAITIVMMGLATGLLVLLDHNIAMSRTMRFTVGCAFILSNILTIITALTMGARLNHHVGIEAANAIRIPVLGWSLTVGDLRVPHFLATHLMQIGPLGAWFAGRLLPREAAVFCSLGLCLLWAAFTLWVFQSVLGGRPWPLVSSRVLGS